MHLCCIVFGLQYNTSQLSFGFVISESAIDRRHRNLVDLRGSQTELGLGAFGFNRERGFEKGRVVCVARDIPPVDRPVQRVRRIVKVDAQRDVGPGEVSSTISSVANRSKRASISVERMP